MAITFDVDTQDDEVTGGDGADLSPIQLDLAGSSDSPGGGFGVDYLGPTVSTAPSRLTLGVYDRLNSTSYGTLTTPFDVGWRDTVNQPGSAKFSIPNTATTDIAMLDLGRLVRLGLDGQVVFTMRIEETERRSVAPGEEHDQFTVATGRGLIAQWDSAVVYPPNGTARPWTDQRVFSWASKEYDDTSWGSGVSLSEPFNGQIDTWPDPYAGWVWSRSPVSGAQPVGSSYWRHDFTLAAEATIAIYVAADDYHQTWLDGVLLGDGPETPEWSWDKTWRALVTCDAGTHTLAVRAENFDRPGNTQNIAWLRVAVIEATTNGSAWYAGTTNARSGSGTWPVKDYPASPPGMTAGAVIDQLLDEAQTRGSLDNWTLGFTATIDSAGNAWPELPETVIPVGTTYIEALEQLAENDIDFAARPGALVLDAWVKGQRGTDRSGTASLAAGSNLLELTHRSRF
jgi:hypothetical protein